MNKNLLRSKMMMHGDIDGDLANVIGVSRASFSAKINECRGREFTQGEIAKIIKRYNLTPEETHGIFFDNLVSRQDTRKNL